MTWDWLIEAVRRVGLEPEQAPPDLDGASANEAWSITCKAYGISPDALAGHVADHFGLPIADLYEFDAEALEGIPEKFARRYDVFPLREEDGTLVVATCDPTDLGTGQSLAFVAGSSPRYQIAPPEAIREVIKIAYGGGPSIDEILETLLEPFDDDAFDAIHVLEGIEPGEVEVRNVEETPVTKLTTLILRDAVTRRASEIQMEPSAGGGVVRFRIDGVLQDHMSMPLPALGRVVSRIKSLGNHDRLRPGDGRIRIRVGEEGYDLRVSMVPTGLGEKAVIRILDPKASMRFDDLDLPGPELERFRELLSYRNGIVIVTGPAGSGKKNTLYAGIREIATGDVNVVTVEDSIEHELPGVTRVQVDPDRDVSLASALRATLRQDADVVFVGEIRDLETAELAVRASTTGRLVLATLQADSAVGSISRLDELGLDLFTVESTLRGALAQRLVRRVCPHCVKELGEDDPLTSEEEHLVERYGVRPRVRAVGCDRCVETGYLGRIPVSEVFLMDYRMADLVSRGAPAAELERAAVAGGMRPMLESAVERAKAGETTLQEVARVLGPASDGDTRAAREASSEAADPGIEEPAPEPGAPEPVEEAGTRILVVDDDPQTRRLVRVLLEDNDYHVTEANNGDVALQLIRESKTPYSLILLDLNMPHLGGQEVLSVLRGSERGRATPVVVLTASNGKSEVQVLDRGADDYVPKPVVPDRLIARIRATLRRAETYRAN